MSVALDHRSAAGVVFERWLSDFGEAVDDADADGVAELFVADGYWKDILALTGSFGVYHGREGIGRQWVGCQGAVGLRDVRLSPDRAVPRATRRTAREVIEGFFDFETAAGRGTGFVRLVPDEDEYWSRPQAWLLLTTLQELRGCEERIGRHRPMYVETSPRSSVRGRRAGRIVPATTEREVLIIGAGQAGLALAARLGRMGANCLVLEQSHRVGDNWRNRYGSLTLHNEVWANHLPYLPFPESWPTFLPKDKVGDWLEVYAHLLDIDVWTGAETASARFDDSETQWVVDVLRDGVHQTICCPHLVIATGSVSGIPRIPTLPGLEMFHGDVLHSSQFKSGDSYRGRHTIVVGTGNSAHDIAQELHSAGAAAVSMIQRSPTCVVSLIPSATLVYALYSEGRSADDTDLVMAALPYELFVESSRWVTSKTCQLDANLLSRLNQVGFETDFEPDGTGFYMKYLRRGGGYYIDVGCSELIADGKIRLIQARDTTRFTADGLQLQDGSLVRADLVVLATGYQNQQEGIRRLLGDGVADRLGEVWGFDEHHMMRNMWQRTPQAGLWLAGGAFLDCRFYTRFLAVQILADLRGVRIGACE